MKRFEIGSGDFWYSFFSTVAYRLEGAKWGSNISEDITDLSNYFVTSEGEDFVSVFLDALETAKEIKFGIEIVSR